MRTVPSPLPETGKFRKLYGWLNSLRDAVISLQPVQSHNQKTAFTSLGVSREPNAGVQLSNGPASNKPVWLP